MVSDEEFSGGITLAHAGCTVSVLAIAVRTKLEYWKLSLTRKAITAQTKYRRKYTLWAMVCVVGATIKTDVRGRMNR